ncbi:MAG: S-layer homology domain-containing protein [Oscillospiraceae bacterium]|nr:S-layer homology domain-containing protein [Oscillospiraceae bacterium]
MKTFKGRLLTLILTLTVVISALSPAVWAAGKVPTVRTTSALAGKRILFLGDSLQTGYGLSDYSLSWNVMLESRGGMIATNCSISGSTMCNEHNGSYAWESISTRTLPEGSFDVVLIDGGANDWFHDLPIGSDPSSRDAANLMGAINVVLDRVQDAYPTALILYMTVWENDILNAQGKTGDDFSEAAAAVCARRNVPCLTAHLPEVSGIYAQDPEFRQRYFRSSTDYWHLNAAGHALFYPVIASWLEQELLDHYLADDFYDVPNFQWYAEAVSGICERGLMVGTDSHHFSPSEKTTRAMLVSVLYRAAGSPDVSELICPFGDVSETAYYYDAVKWGCEKGIVYGLSEDTFGPSQPLSREQLVTFLYRFAEAAEPQEFDSTAEFRDWESVSDYAKNAMCWAVSQGIVSGVTDTTLAPQNTATRAQLAAVLLRYLDGASKA